MPFYYPDQALAAMLTIWTDRFTINGYYLKLYQNDVDLLRTLILSDMVEADFSGYAVVKLDTWLGVLFDPAGRAYDTHHQLDYSHDGGGVANTIYGCYVEDDLGQLLGLMPLPDGPKLMASGADLIQITPILVNGMLPQLG